MSRFFVLGILFLSVASALRAEPSAFDYALKAETVAEGVHLVLGKRENFTRDNGGDIQNVGFIETADGVVLIDTGPSRRYGEQLRALIASMSDKAIERIYITHAHPDHFLGNQAFDVAKIHALPKTRAYIREAGDDLAANLYRMVGGWMLGTEAIVPNGVASEGEVEIGGRLLKLFALAGHTTADLVVFDVESKTLFAGDLVFFERAATTPNADVDQWLQSLDALTQIEFEFLVPGHGPVVRDRRAIRQTRDYLKWLRDLLEESADQGLDLNEVMRQPVPEKFRSLAVFREEFDRSVVHLFPAIEQERLRPAK